MKKTTFITVATGLTFSQFLNGQTLDNLQLERFSLQNRLINLDKQISKVLSTPTHKIDSKRVLHSTTSSFNIDNLVVNDIQMVQVSLDKIQLSIKLGIEEKETPPVLPTEYETDSNISVEDEKETKTIKSINDSNTSLEDVENNSTSVYVDGINFIFNEISLYSYGEFGEFVTYYRLNDINPSNSSDLNMSYNQETGYYEMYLKAFKNIVSDPNLNVSLNMTYSINDEYRYWSANTNMAISNPNYYVDNEAPKIETITMTKEQNSSSTYRVTMIIKDNSQDKINGGIISSLSKQTNLIIDGNNYSYIVDQSEMNHDILSGAYTYSINYYGLNIYDESGNYMNIDEEAKLPQMFQIKDNGSKIIPYTQGDIATKQVINATNIGEWCLLGTTYGVHNPQAVFENVTVAWSYNNGIWSAYSKNTQAILDANYTLINTIEPNSGFWIYK